VSNSIVYICDYCWPGGEELCIGGLTEGSLSYTCAVCARKSAREKVHAISAINNPINLQHKQWSPNAGCDKGIMDTFLKDEEKTMIKKLIVAKVGQSQTYFYNPENGKCYEPTVGFTVTGDDLSDKFVEVPAARLKKDLALEDQEIPVLKSSDNPKDDLAEFFRGITKKDKIFEIPIVLFYADPMNGTVKTSTIEKWSDLVEASGKFESGEWGRLSNLSFSLQILAILFNRLEMLR